MRQPGGLALLLLLLVLAALLGRTAAAPAVLSGEVRDDNGPVADARVRIHGQSLLTRTGAAGRFELPGPFRPGDRVTAAREGHLIAGAPVGRKPLALTLPSLPAEDCERYRWVDPEPDPARPQNCGSCHEAIYREWSQSAHARSVTGRHFRNLYDGSDWHGRPNVGWGLLRDNPDGAGVCTSCHAPTVGFDDAAYYDLRQAHGTAAEGVHCDYCHKVAGTTGEPGLTHGRFGLRLLRPAAGQLFFGPMDDVDRGEDVYSPLYGRSRYCASCHEGVVFGVRVYETYSEWLHSPARREGKQCQSCHMAASGTLTNIAPGKGGLPRDPRTLANHRFLAGDLAAMLRRCLHVSTDAERSADGVRVRVEVRVEDVGHRVPTGFVDRNLVLSVEGYTEAGVALSPHSGPTLPLVAGPELAGRPGRLYAKVLHDFAGHTPAPFWRADPDLTDTRLRPGQTDQSEFSFPSELRRVRVRLLYRRFWPQVAQAKGWPDNETVSLDEMRSAP
jgi:hypothetical protein